MRLFNWLTEWHDKSRLWTDPVFRYPLVVGLAITLSSLAFIICTSDLQFEPGFNGLKQCSHYF